MEEKKMTEQESLELIAQMIVNTRERVKKNAGMPFLIFGYVTIAVALLTWYMVTGTENYWWHFLWFLVPLVGMSLNALLFKKERKLTKSYLDRIISIIWLVTGSGVMLASLLTFHFYHLPIMFLIMLMISMAVTMTGLVIRFKTAIGFGIFGMLSSIAFLFFTGSNQILIFAAVFFVMMVIPGHYLNYVTKKDSCSKN
jgi:hypothetical protein